MITLLFALSLMLTTTDTQESLNYQHFINEFYGITPKEYVDDDIDDDIYIEVNVIGLDPDEIETDIVETPSGDAQ